MTEIDLTIDTNSHLIAGETVRIRATGALADALRSCILRAADRYAGDPDVQRLAAAVAALSFDGRKPDRRPA